MLLTLASQIFFESTIWLGHDQALFFSSPHRLTLPFERNEPALVISSIDGATPQKVLEKC